MRYGPVTLQLGGSVRLQTGHGPKLAQLGDMPFGRALGHGSTGHLIDLDYGEWQIPIRYKHLWVVYIVGIFDCVIPV